MTRYLDIHGDEHERPASAPVSWRIGGYGIIARSSSLLMVRTVLPSAWTWDLPGGGIRLDPEETIIEGIVREVYEETGYRFEPDADTLSLTDDTFFRPPSGDFWRMLTFTVQGNVEDEPDSQWIPPDDEIAEVAWIDPATLGSGDILLPHWATLARLGYLREPTS